PPQLQRCRHRKTAWHVAWGDRRTACPLARSSQKIRAGFLGRKTMNRQPSFQQFWEDFFGRFRKLPPPQMDPAWDRVLDRSRDHSDDVLVDPAFSGPAIPSVQGSPRWRVAVLIAAAAIIVLVVF